MIKEVAIIGIAAGAVIGLWPNQIQQVEPLHPITPQMVTPWHDPSPFPKVPPINPSWPELAPSAPNAPVIDSPDVLYDKNGNVREKAPMGGKRLV